MAATQQLIKKTGYQDIDEILIDVNELLLESDQLQKEIAEAIKFKPKNPSFSSRRRALKQFRFTNR